jgi:regulator of cell morphogenesis and NO signaling
LGQALESRPLRELVRHIVDHHHEYTRRQLAHLVALSGGIVGAEGEIAVELSRVREVVEAIASDLGPHLMREEVVLFPYIEDLEAARRAGRERPFAPFGCIDNPVRAMMHEHDHVDARLRELRKLTRDYQPPPEAGPACVELYADLRALDEDLVDHMHLEADVLFPRALELERG